MVQSPQFAFMAKTRQITGKGEISVTAEDNAMILMNHGNEVLSHMPLRLQLFHPARALLHPAGPPHDHPHRHRGSMSLAGYDWTPHAVDLATREHNRFQRHADARSDYVWENGASLVAECLVTGREPLFTPEHALHVVEIMTAANESQMTGRRIPIRSTFKWPVV